MKFLIIDANSIINRAFYAIKPLTNKDGLHTNGVYGFLTTILREIESEKPDYIACAFDVSRITFRTELYSDYKGTRKETPEELREQFPLLKSLLNSMNIPVIELQNYEADDIIGTISKKCSEEKTECVILTGDKDDLQLICDYTRVKLIITRMGKTETTKMDTEAVFEKYGLTPSELIDLKALMGDKSDNIPGVAGIGEVSGLKLIQEYKTLENIYENIDNIKESLRKKLLADKENAFLSRKLGTIDRNTPIDTDLSKYLKIDYDITEYAKMLEYLGFKSILAKLMQASPEIKVPTAPSLKSEIEILDGIAIPDITTLFFLIDNEYIFVNHNKKIYRYDKSDSFIAGLLADENCNKISYNIKNSLHMGFDIKNPVYDVCVMSYVCNPKFSGEPEKILMEFLNVTAENSEQQILYLDELYKALNEIIDKNELFYINAMEHALIFTLYGMEIEGIAADEAALDALSVRFTAELLELSNKIYEHAGQEFNINSPKQLGEILFDKLGLESKKKTKSGYSTNAEVLEKLSDSHPIIELIKEHRQISKLNSTYVEGLKLAKDQNNIIRTTYKQTLTQTGRLSSIEPNLQNIPIRSPLGRKIRETIIPKNDLLISADYSQIELRVLAHISNDQNLIDAFLENQDIHTITAQKIFGVDDITPNMRRAAKAVNFGLIYGKGAFSLAKDLGITRWEAEEYIGKYLGQYPNVSIYMSEVIENAKKDGYTKTLYNRRRYFPELNDKNHLVRTAAERAALNSPIQGTAADIIKLAMINVDKKLKENGFKSKLALQIHDELIIDCFSDEKEALITLLKECMENAVSLSVPLTVSVSTGKNLDECK